MEDVACSDQVPFPSQALHEANVVHFDIKCDNVQLDPLPGTSHADIAAPPTAEPTFRVVLVDFGESKDFGVWLRRTWVTAELTVCQGPAQRSS
jgi:serine/threonine protein kinase